MKHAIQDADGTITIIDLPDPPHIPLNSAGTVATLLAVLGIVSLEDAAHAAQRTPEDLVHEAQSWAVVKEINNANS